MKVWLWALNEHCIGSSTACSRTNVRFYLCHVAQGCDGRRLHRLVDVNIVNPVSLMRSTVVTVVWLELLVKLEVIPQNPVTSTLEE